MFLLEHVIEATGWHYIRNKKTNRRGTSAGYQSIATYVSEDGTQRFFAVTGYHANGVSLREGIVYEFQAQSR